MEEINKTSFSFKRKKKKLLRVEGLLKEFFFTLHSDTAWDDTQTWWKDNENGGTGKSRLTIWLSERIAEE
jgi:hypothetical protein